jgi:polyisoprenyl-phosphate glycosyltransferase
MNTTIKINKYSIIIPVFNAEKSITELCNRIENVFVILEYNYEIILVNDYSKDNSWDIMRELQEKDNRIKIINLARNCGQHSAMMCGLNNFTGDFVIFMDDDLQHPPEEIPKLINHIENNPNIDVVIGAFLHKKHSIIRNLGSKLNSLIVGKTIFNKESNFSFTNFRILRGNIAKSIAKINIHKPRIGQLILQTTQNISFIVVNHDERKYGKSGYTFFRLVKDFFSNIISNSILPLKLISSFGIFIAIFSFGAGLFYLIRYLIYGTSITGWTSLIVITTFLSGFILLSLGIIGEYLLRILDETKKMPNYVEREKYF